MKSCAQQAQQQNWAPASPTGTTCLIGKAGLLGRIVKRFSARSCSPWGAKTSHMGVSNPATPKYKISHPNIPPNMRNSERNHLPATSGIVYTYLLVSPTPIQQSRPITHPPFHLAPSAYQPIHLLTQRTLLLILTSPGTTAKSFFLDGGVYLVWIYEVTWGIPGYSCINVTAMAVTLGNNLRLSQKDIAHIYWYFPIFFRK